MTSARSMISALALLAAAPLVGQEPARVYVSTPRAATGYSVRPDIVTTSSGRGVIGVGVDLHPGPNDSVGATISTVTPGGAAAGAGLVAGDIITKFNGTALVERGSRNSDNGDADQSQPGLRLLELASRVSPGDTVAVEWKHGRQRKTAQLVTQPAATMAYTIDGTPSPDIVRFYTGDGPGRFKFNTDGPGAMVELQGRLEALRAPMAMGGMPGDRMFMRMGGAFGGIQFAPVNADLGRYFGTSEGILVLETPDTSAHIDLKGGDVILAIGDRKPANVEHMLRILGSYQDSEVVHFDVMRDHRRVTVDAKAEDLQSENRVEFLENRLERSHIESDLPRPVPDHVESTPRPSEPRHRRPGV